MSDPTNPLDAFLPATRAWFTQTLGEPTPPQLQGWPAIQRGDHTLILAPTGSGKTLSAFLWGIDRLFHELLATVRQSDAEAQRRRENRGHWSPHREETARSHIRDQINSQKKRGGSQAASLLILRVSRSTH